MFDEIVAPTEILMFSPNARVFVGRGKNKNLYVISAKEDGRWHMSISHPKRLPSWEEIKDARKATLPPNIFLCVLFPPEEFWLNIHDYCMHLWQIEDEKLIEHMISQTGRIALR